MRFVLTVACGLRFLLISQPQIATVSYVKIDDQGKASTPKVLIETRLSNPLGLAVDPNNNYLYVADPVSRKIFRYKYIFSNGGLVTNGAQYVAASDVEARWVSVDEAGDVFFTEEAGNTVKKLARHDPALKGALLSQTLYTSDTSMHVSSPGGITADMRYFYWTNKTDGKSKGVVVRAENVVAKAGPAKVLAGTIDEAYGVCVNQNHVYFTAKTSTVYVVDKEGGQVGTASSSFVSPRGCAWDGDATIYVADKKGNAIMGFPAGHTIAPVDTEKFVTVEDPFDVVLVTGGATAAMLPVLTWASWL